MQGHVHRHSRGLKKLTNESSRPEIHLALGLTSPHSPPTTTHTKQCHTHTPNKTGQSMGSPPPLPPHELDAQGHGSTQFDEILRSLPTVDFGFAYGSGVFDQDGYHDDDDHHQATTGGGDATATPSIGTDPARLPMLDLVLAVRNPIEWHRENLGRNWKHYSVLRYLGAERLGQIQGERGAWVKHWEVGWKRMLRCLSVRSFSPSCGQRRKDRMRKDRRRNK